MFVSTWIVQCQSQVVFLLTTANTRNLGCGILRIISQNLLYLARLFFEISSNIKSIGRIYLTLMQQGYQILVKYPKLGRNNFHDHIKSVTFRNILRISELLLSFFWPT